MGHFTQADWILTPGETPIKGAGLELDKASGSILAVMPADLDDLEAEGTTFLTPGLINAHTHLELYADSPIPIHPGESMADWLTAIKNSSLDTTDAGRLEACRKSIHEMIKTGTTCVNDLTSTGMSLEALDQVGMRAVVSPEFFAPSHDEDPDISKLVAKMVQFKTRFQNHPLLEIGVSPHSPYNVHPNAWQKAVDETDPVLVHTHLAETLDEMMWFQNGVSPLDEVHKRFLGKRFGPSQSGVTPVEAVQSVLSSKTVAAHGVHLTDNDIEILAKAGVSLVHCPRSNEWLTGQTISNLAALKAKDIAIGLGTDSRLSCPSLDLREEARVAQQRHGLSAQQTFELATAGSAEAIKMGHKLGRIAPGYAADIVLWQHPDKNITNPYEAWLSPETDVLAVWINGRIVLEKAFV